MTKDDGFGVSARTVAALRRTSCDRLRALMVSGFSRKGLAQSFEISDGSILPGGALAFGARFEAALFSKRNGQDAARFIDSLRDAEFIGKSDVVDVFRLDPTSSDACEQTLALLVTKGSDRARVILGAALELPRLSAHRVKPDALVSAAGSSVFLPFEVKSYEGRFHLTEESRIASSAEQAALALYALRVVAPEAALTQSNHVGLVFRRIGTMSSGDACRVDVSRNIAIFDQLLAYVAAGARVDAVELQAIEDRYQDACAGSCVLESHCWAVRRARDEPVAYGDAAAELFEGFASVEAGFRALDGVPSPHDPPRIKALRLAFEQVSRLRSRALVVAEQGG